MDISAEKTFILPYPPSANRYWRVARGIVHKSNEARKYQKKAAILALVAGVRPTDGDVSLLLEVHRPAKRGDLDNSIKVLLDAIKGVAYLDDKQVVKLVAERFDSPENPRVEVTLKMGR